MRSVIMRNHLQYLLTLDCDKTISLYTKTSERTKKPSTDTVFKRPKFSELKRIEACVEGESTHTY